jgi:hypothetical protein
MYIFPRINLMIPIPNYSQQDATFLIYLFLQTLYTFQAVSPPINRSTQLHIQFRVLSTNTAASCYRGGDGTEFHLLHGSS